MPKVRSTQAIMNDIKKKRDLQNPKGKEWYNLRPVLGCANRAWFYILLGGKFLP